MVKVGIIGWRGIVGSTVLDRMTSEHDFKRFEPFFFSSSASWIGKKKNTQKNMISKIKDAYDLKKLSYMNIIVSCQGSKYTKYVHKKLRNNGWSGYWIDSSSELRSNKQSIIALDPINKKRIQDGLSKGILNYIGGNCTVSLMLMAVHKLIENNWVKWITSMTYQAASGAGSKQIKNSLLQNKLLKNNYAKLFNSSSSILDISHNIIRKTKNYHLDKYLKEWLTYNLFPWIDVSAKHGQTKEEKKAFFETNKIMNLKGNKTVHIDGQCVRVNILRCHSQALTIKLKRNISINDIESTIIKSNKWVKLIPNDKKNTIKFLNPIEASETLNILVGRIHKLNIGKKYLTIFTVGDQLLWGAAEPIRRVLNIIIDYIS